MPRQEIPFSFPDATRALNAESHVVPYSPGFAFGFTTPTSGMIVFVRGTELRDENIQAVGVASPRVSGIAYGPLHHKIGRDQILFTGKAIHGWTTKIGLRRNGGVILESTPPPSDLTDKQLHALLGKTNPASIHGLPISLDWQKELSNIMGSLTLRRGR